MNLFDKKFVRFMWEDELESKMCFVADKINVLEAAVNIGDSEQVKIT